MIVKPSMKENEELNEYFEDCVKRKLGEANLSKEQIEIINNTLSSWSDNLKQQGIEVIDVKYEAKGVKPECQNFLFTEEDLNHPLPEMTISWTSTTDGEINDEEYKIESNELKTKEGVKDYKGKLRWSLLPFEALEGTIRVLMYGAITKYSPDNWKKVREQGTYVDAIFRHLSKYKEGEEFDEETGESHLAHLICDALFLEYNRMNRNQEIPFEDYIRELLMYDDYKKFVTQGEIDARFGRNKI